MTTDAIDTDTDIRFPGRDALLGGALVPGEGDGPRPGVVLIPDVRGVSALYREFAADLGAAGFTTLVVDLYSREGTPQLPDMASITRWIADLPDRRVLADVEDAVRWLASRAGVRADAIAVLGFCLGGQFATMAACTIPGLRAAVSFYGMLRQASRGAHKLPDPLELAPALGCAFLGQYGAEDELIPTADIEALRVALPGSRRRVELVVYPGAGHAFLNRQRPEAFREAAAATAWARAREFLRSELAG